MQAKITMKEYLCQKGYDISICIEDIMRSRKEAIFQKNTEKEPSRHGIEKEKNV